MRLFEHAHYKTISAFFIFSSSFISNLKIIELGQGNVFSLRYYSHQHQLCMLKLSISKSQIFKFLAWIWTKKFFSLFNIFILKSTVATVKMVAIKFVGNCFTVIITIYRVWIVINLNNYSTTMSTQTMRYIFLIKFLLIISILLQN